MGRAPEYDMAQAVARHAAAPMVVPMKVASCGTHVMGDPGPPEVSGLVKGGQVQTLVVVPLSWVCNVHVALFMHQGHRVTGEGLALGLAEEAPPPPMTMALGGMAQANPW